MSEGVRLRPASSSRIRCPYCHDQIEAGPKTTQCSACHALYHQECVRESQTSSTKGCVNRGCRGSLPLTRASKELREWPFFSRELQLHTHRVIVPRALLSSALWLVLSLTRDFALHEVVGLTLVLTAFTGLVMFVAAAVSEIVGDDFLVSPFFGIREPSRDAPIRWWEQSPMHLAAAEPRACRCCSRPAEAGRYCATHAELLEVSSLEIKLSPRRSLPDTESNLAGLPGSPSD